MKTEQRHLSPFQTLSPVEWAEQSCIILVAEKGEHAVALDVKQDMSRSLKFVNEICKKYIVWNYNLTHISLLLPDYLTRTCEFHNFCVIMQVFTKR